MPELRAVPPPPDEPRMPAHDTGAEGAVISALLVSPAAAARVVQMLRPDDFYAESHRRIVEAVFALFNVGRPTDLVTVATWLRDHGRLEQVGGSAYMTEVLSAAPAVGHVEAYAETVVRKSRVRRMQAACARIVAESYSPIGDEDEWVDRAEAAVHEVGAARTKGIESRTMTEVAESVYKSWEEAANNPDAAVATGGVSTGLNALDSATGGFHPGEVWTMGGSPGIGKTAIAMQFATDVILRGFGAAFFSFEMPSEQLATRQLCSTAGVDSIRARNRTFTRNDWSSLLTAIEAQQRFKNLHLVDKTCGLLEMRSVCRTIAANLARLGAPLRFVVVDYLQLMPRDPSIKQREEGISENARGLKRLAKEFGVTVLVLSQLVLDVIKRDNKRPTMADFKESGAILESTDVGVGVYRHGYYNKSAPNPHETELIIMKQKHGPTGTVHVGFDERATRFYDLPGDQGANWQDGSDR